MANLRRQLFDQGDPPEQFQMQVRSSATGGLPNSLAVEGLESNRWGPMTRPTSAQVVGFYLVPGSFNASILKGSNLNSYLFHPRCASSAWKECTSSVLAQHDNNATHRRLD